MAWPFARSTLLLVPLLALSACGAKEEVKTPVRPVRVAEVTLTKADAAARYTGTVVARTDTVAAFRVGGRITQRLVDVGNRVEAGQTLARLDPTDLKLSLRQAEARLAQAEATAVQAAADLRRYTPLLRSGHVSQAQFDQVKATSQAADAQLAEAKSALALARNELSYAELTLTQAGTVTALDADVGQVVASGQAVLHVATDLGREVAIDVAESQVTKLTVGTAATVSLWADQELKLTGKVREITPTADTASRTFRVRVALPDDQADKVRLGMTATVLFDRETFDEVVLLPSTSLFQQGDKPAVWVLNDKRDRVVLRPVTIAQYKPDAIVVAGGLKPGEMVVTAGVHRLDANLPVRVWDGGLP
jgi:RND family efflux transporter MFP subunit